MRGPAPSAENPFSGTGPDRPHPLAGHLSVDESAKRIRHYRYVEERMMRIMGGWIALTPELSAKLLLGRHVWDCAQHADLWGRRLPELRAPAQVSEPPNLLFVRFVDALESSDGPHQSVERLVGIYRVLKPHLLAAYETHLAQSNPVYEPPTRRILQRCLDEERRHIAAGRAVLTHLLRAGTDTERAHRWQSQLEALLVESGGVTGAGAEKLGTREVPDDPTGAQDFIRLEQPIARWPFPPGLEAAIESHARRARERDPAGIRTDLAPACEESLKVYRSLPGGDLGDHEVVALARIGAQWVVKLRFLGQPGALLQLRWAFQDGRWLVLEAELVRAEPRSS
jgi:hypothetical protein